MKDASDLSSPADSKCRIAEILQYSCELKTESHSGRQISQCFPITRLFKMCPGLSAVEITKLVNIDMATGEVEIPANISQNSIRARPWKEIVRYEQNDDRSSD
ncbi:hypothetical protein B0H34DRAFT_750515 [Crassisporium funariophilum]|nr:hypothetical protein B0H34DRAFT_750515 [Crassisporium funariophilum]